MKIEKDNQIVFYDGNAKEWDEFIEFAEKNDKPEGKYWVTVSATFMAQLLKEANMLKGMKNE